MALYSKLKDLLSQAGLGETSILVYLELLKQPTQNIWELVTRTGLSKSAVYRAFENLVALKMVEKNETGIHALSLKNFVENLYRKERRLFKLANKIKKIAPFLRANENIEEFETMYGDAEITDAYLMMAQMPYSINFDFGDFESLCRHVGGLSVAEKFRDTRVKHAKNLAICTTFGPLTSYFCTKEAEIKYKNYVSHLDLDFKNKFVIFSDTCDHVLFSDVSDGENPTAVLVKSKVVADSQRTMFDNFSRKIGN